MSSRGLRLSGLLHLRGLDGGGGGGSSSVRHISSEWSVGSDTIDNAVSFSGIYEPWKRTE